MNQDAQTLLLQMEARRELLHSLETSGRYVRQDEKTGLCVGTVQGTPALVPVELADTITQRQLSTMNQRSLGWEPSWQPMAPIVADELNLLDVEYAWVMECGTGARP